MVKTSLVSGGYCLIKSHLVNFSYVETTRPNWSCYQYVARCLTGKVVTLRVFHKLLSNTQWQHLDKTFEKKKWEDYKKLNIKY